MRQPIDKGQRIPNKGVKASSSWVPSCRSIIRPLISLVTDFKFRSCLQPYDPTKPVGWRKNRLSNKGDHWDPVITLMIPTNHNVLLHTCSYIVQVKKPFEKEHCRSKYTLMTLKSPTLSIQHWIAVDAQKTLRISGTLTDPNNQKNP